MRPQRVELEGVADLVAGHRNRADLRADVVAEDAARPQARRLGNVGDLPGVEAREERRVELLVLQRARHRPLLLAAGREDGERERRPPGPATEREVHAAQRCFWLFSRAAP